MSIEEIAVLLNDSEHWEQVLTQRAAVIDAQLAVLTRARKYLTHLSSCPHGPELENCPEFRAGVDVPKALQ